MKKVEALLIAATVLFLSAFAAVGVDYTSSTWVDGEGVIQSQYTLWGGPFTTFSQWTLSSNGALHYTGDYTNGGAIRWTVTPPKDPKTLKEYWEDKPSIFVSSFSRTGFPARSTTPSFASTFNSFGSRFGGSTFKPITGFGS